MRGSRACCSTCRRGPRPTTYLVRARPSRRSADLGRTAARPRPYAIESGGFRCAGLGPQRASFDDGRANVQKRSVVLVCVVALVALGAWLTRSEERRVGKEGRS